MSCGSTGQRTCEMAGWAACVPPAEMCNGVDDNCDGVSDESFDYVPTTPVNVSNDPAEPGEYSNEPVLAWTGDGYGFAWDDELAGDGTQIMMLDPAGAATSPLLYLGPGRTPSIAFGGGAFAVVFWQRTTDSTTMVDTHHVNLRFVGTDGMPVTDMMQIQSGVDGDPRPRVVWDGSAFVVSYRDSQVYYHRFAPDGTEMGSRVPVPASLPERADLAFDGTVYAFGWDRSGTVYFTRGSDTAGFPMDATAVAPGANAQGTGLAATENGYVMAWRTGTDQVQTLGLDATGTPRAMPMTISTTAAARNSGNFPNRNWVEVHQAPGQVLVLYVDARDGDRGLYAARIAPDGSVLQMPTRIAEAPPMNGDMPQATWADDRFAVSWEELASLARTEVLFSTFGCP